MIARCVDELQAAVDSFVELIRALPATALESDAWGPREILAHLAFWHEHYVYLLMTQLEGETPELPIGSSVTLNRIAVERFHDIPVETVARRLESAERLLEELVERPGAARTRVRIKVGGKAWPLRTFLERVAGHIRGHESHLRRSLGLPRRRAHAARRMVA